MITERLYIHTDYNITFKPLISHVKLSIHSNVPYTPNIFSCIIAHTSDATAHLLHKAIISTSSGISVIQH